MIIDYSSKNEKEKAAQYVNEASNLLINEEIEEIPSLCSIEFALVLQTAISSEEDSIETAPFVRLLSNILTQGPSLRSYFQTREIAELLAHAIVSSRSSNQSLYLRAFANILCSCGRDLHQYCVNSVPIVDLLRFGSSDECLCLQSECLSLYAAGEQSESLSVSILNATAEALSKFRVIPQKVASLGAILGVLRNSSIPPSEFSKFARFIFDSLSSRSIDVQYEAAACCSLLCKRGLSFHLDFVAKLISTGMSTQSERVRTISFEAASDILHTLPKNECLSIEIFSQCCAKFAGCSFQSKETIWMFIAEMYWRLPRSNIGGIWGFKEAMMEATELGDESVCSRACEVMFDFFGNSTDEVQEEFLSLLSSSGNEKVAMIYSSIMRKDEI